MTEFRKAATAVEAVERAVGDLMTSLADGAVVAGEAQQTAFAEAQRLLQELEGPAQKMRAKCEARAELDVVKTQLLQCLASVDGAPAASAEDVLKVAQDLVDAGAAGTESLQAPLARAAELEGTATYGAKMVEKVLDLLARLDAARGSFNEQVVPKLGGEMAAASAALERRREEAEQQAREAEAAAARQAEEERLRPVQALVAANEEAARRQREEEEAAERKRRQEEEAADRAAAALAEEEEALRKAEVESELVLKERGPDAACARALVSMLGPISIFRSVIDGLGNMLGGIASAPEEMQLRVVRLSNARFHENLATRCDSSSETIRTMV
eukprot:TRINITY_DN18529_c0_g1_i4.p1 TRINITY_DN18529_c0_g1~~TRINITY_DN18529_c0_g1_i4.p1  ORF type:complete len:351 (-),score=118.24 TRINITY_DN18529_c0_g1_i4:623-1612(-)